ncbi:MAG TPA: extracellular solute-binding protein, partial [Promineifilum sp.]|nr:extracellular solute-binding protein [Promineifilum sp.]
MKKLIGLIILIALAAVACGGGPTGGPGASATEATEAETSEGEVKLAPQLSVYNWADYIDVQALADYTERYGVEIIYDTYASNEDLLAKLQAGASGYDVVFPSDYMVAQMIELGLLAEVDAPSLPNFVNIGEEFRDPPYDPGNAHCVPYKWGMTGIAYRLGNPAFEAGPPNSWAWLFEPNLME